MERGEVAGVRGRAKAGRLAPRGATERAPATTGPVTDLESLRPRTPPGVGTPLRAEGLQVSATRPGAKAKFNGALITLREPPSPGPKVRHRPRGIEREERRIPQVKLGGQAAGPFHCSRNARPVGKRGVSAPRGRAGENRKQALVGRAQFGPALLPARRKPSATRERKKMTFPIIAEAQRLAREWKPRDK